MFGFIQLYLTTPRKAFALLASLTIWVCPLTAYPIQIEPSISSTLNVLLEDIAHYVYTFPPTNGPAHGGDLYQHSMWTHFAAIQLLETPSPYTQNITLTPREKDVFALAALLHDIGKAGRKELFNRSHQKLAYQCNCDGSICYVNDNEEHCTIGFEYIAAKLLTNKSPFTPQTYYLADGTAFSCTNLFHELNINCEEQKLVALLVGIHWSFGNVRRGLMTEEAFMQKLQSLVGALNYNHGFIDEKLLRLSILINNADVLGIHPCPACTTWLFTRPHNIEPTKKLSSLCPYEAFGVFEKNNPQPKGVKVMNRLIDYYHKVYSNNL